MKINIATLFPEMCEAVVNTSIIGRAKAAGKIDVEVFNIRDYTLNKHKNVDDTPYGGGHGMVMQTQPIYDCCKAIEAKSTSKPFVIFTTAAGRVFNQELAIELSQRKTSQLCAVIMKALTKGLLKKLPIWKFQSVILCSQVASCRRW